MLLWFAPNDCNWRKETKTEFKTTGNKMQNRSLPPDAPDKFPWLKYSPSTRSVNCGCCFLRHGFGPRFTSKAETWGDLEKKGYNNRQMFGRKANANSGSRLYGNCRHVNSVGHAKDLHQALKNSEDGIDVQLDNVVKVQLSPQLPPRRCCCQPWPPRFLPQLLLCLQPPRLLLCCLGCPT